MTEDINLAPDSNTPPPMPRAQTAAGSETQYKEMALPSRLPVNPQMQLQVDKLLKEVVRRGASDLHIAPGKRPMLRLCGSLVELDTEVVTADRSYAAFKALADDRAQEELELMGGTDFAYEISKARFRINAYKEEGGVSMAMRRLPSRILTIDEIGLPFGARDLLQKPRGLLLVTGPTGSGKTTTLAAIINEISHKSGVHIVTLEDPIEYRFSHGASIVSQRQLGKHFKDYPGGLRHALRQDPDVIMVGEMRDLETMRVAIAAAETGHLVLATLHTSSAAKTVDRLIEAFPENEQNQIRMQLSTSLRGVISQTLLPKADESGVVAAYEFMRVTPAIANYIRENKTHVIESDMQTGGKLGMRLLDDDLFRLAKNRIIKPTEALSSCNNYKQLEEKLRREGIFCVS